MITLNIVFPKVLNPSTTPFPGPDSISKNSKKDVLISDIMSEKLLIIPPSFDVKDLKIAKILLKKRLNLSGSKKLESLVIMALTPGNTSTNIFPSFIPN